jgi:hypothetical protein
MKIQRSRMITKRSEVPGVEPTVPSSNDHTDGTWLATDIYVGEMFLNVADGKCFTRLTDDSIVEIGAGGGEGGGDYIMLRIDSIVGGIVNYTVIHNRIGTINSVTADNGTVTIEHSDITFSGANCFVNFGINSFIHPIAMYCYTTDSGNMQLHGLSYAVGSWGHSNGAFVELVVKIDLLF